MNTGVVVANATLTAGQPIGPIFIIPQDREGRQCAASFLKDVTVHCRIERVGGDNATLFTFASRQTLRHSDQVGYWFYAINDPMVLRPGEYRLVGEAVIPSGGVHGPARIVSHQRPFSIIAGSLDAIRIELSTDRRDSRGMLTTRLDQETAIFISCLDKVR